MAAAADGVTGYVARWLMLVVVVRFVLVVGHTYREHSHDHHPPGNVWVDTRNRDFVRSFVRALCIRRVRRRNCKNADPVVHVMFF